MDVPVAEPMAYHNGRFIPRAEAHIDLHDAGFVFGATISDFCRTFDRRLFRLPEHLSRFRSNCRYAHIPLEPSDDELVQAAEELVQLNCRFLQDDQEMALILLATPGPLDFLAGRPAAQGRANQPTLVLHTYPLPFKNYVDLFQEGACLAVSAARQVPASSVDPRVKHRSRLHWWLAGEQKPQNTRALLLDQDGYVTETAIANFLIVRAGTVLTPPRTAILDGISLRLTQDLCGQLGIPFVEQPLSVSDCQSADEAFLTGTAFCLAGVRSIDGTNLRWPGPITEALSAAWTQLVGLDYRAQFLAGR